MSTEPERAEAIKMVEQIKTGHKLGGNGFWEIYLFGGVYYQVGGLSQYEVADPWLVVGYLHPDDREDYMIKALGVNRKETV